MVNVPNSQHNEHGEPDRQANVPWASQLELRYKTRAPAALLMRRFLFLPDLLCLSYTALERGRTISWSWRRIVGAHFQQWIVVIEIYNRRSDHQRQGHGKVTSVTEVDGRGCGCRHIQHLLLQVGIQED